MFFANDDLEKIFRQTLKCIQSKVGTQVRPEEFKQAVQALQGKFADQIEQQILDQRRVALDQTLGEAEEARVYNPY